MFAIIEINSKQYKIKENSIIKIEKIEKEVGEIVKYKNILMIEQNDVTKFGTPFLEKNYIVAEIIKQSRDKKIKILKFHRRKHSMKSQGHRQYFTEIRIKEII